MTQTIDLSTRLRPPALQCNVCKASLQPVLRVDVEGLQGIEIAYRAHCDACDQDTWAVRGTPASVRAFYAALEQSVGHKVELGTVKPSTDD